MFQGLYGIPRMEHLEILEYIGTLKTRVGGPQGDPNELNQHNIKIKET